VEGSPVIIKSFEVFPMNKCKWSALKSYIIITFFLIITFISLGDDDYTTSEIVTNYLEEA